MLPRCKDASSLKDATKAKEFALLLLYCPLISLVLDKLNRSPAYSSMEVLNEKVYVYATCYFIYSIQYHPLCAEFQN
jgi:hypothetical protein